jgi:hypothetical protein
VDSSPSLTLAARRWFCRRSLLMFGILPQTDVGNYLFIHRDITALALNHVGWVFLM